MNKPLKNTKRIVTYLYKEHSQHWWISTTRFFVWEVFPRRVIDIIRFFKIGWASTKWNGDSLKNSLQAVAWNYERVCDVFQNFWEQIFRWEVFICAYTGWNWLKIECYVANWTYFHLKIVSAVCMLNIWLHAKICVWPRPNISLGSFHFSHWRTYQGWNSDIWGKQLMLFHLKILSEHCVFDHIWLCAKFYSILT